MSSQQKQKPGGKGVKSGGKAGGGGAAVPGPTKGGPEMGSSSPGEVARLRHEITILRALLAHTGAGRVGEKQWREMSLVGAGVLPGGNQFFTVPSPFLECVVEEAAGGGNNSKSGTLKPSEDDSDAGGDSDAEEVFDQEDVRVKHCTHFDKKAVARLFATFVNRFLHKGEYKWPALQRTGGSAARRDASAFLLELAEMLEELPDSGGNCCDAWKTSCGFCLESQQTVDLWVQLPSGFSFHCWRSE